MSVPRTIPGATDAWGGQAQNPYTCRLLLRIDQILYRIRGRYFTYWSGPDNDRPGPRNQGGHLCERSVHYEGGWEVLSHFPGWMFVLACWLQNRYMWTRKLLSL